jgi:hypothetical protein
MAAFEAPPLLGEENTLMDRVPLDNGRSSAPTVMNRLYNTLGCLLVFWGGLGALIGSALAITTLKGGTVEWLPLLIFGAIGALVGAVGGVVVRICAPACPSPTNSLAVVGLLVGALAGGTVGVVTGLGQPLIALFNPDLPLRDFQSLFGAVGGVFMGAVAGALLGAAMSRILRRKAGPRCLTE